MPETHFREKELSALRDLVRRINRELLRRDTCFYCGDAATAEDHVIPHSFTHGYLTERTGWETDTLPVCRECNNLLGSVVTDTLEERLGFLKKSVKSRYKKALRIPEWTELELGDLAPRMQHMVGQSLQLKRTVKARLNRLSRENPDESATSI